jgi:tRNA 2-thiouridine synthesizing protein B
MPILHIVNKSPFERNTLDSCLRLALDGSAILLIEDGVYAASRKSTTAPRVGEAMQKLPVYALQPDLQARGIAPDTVIDGIELVDYDGFVKLTTEYEKTQSWL